MIYAVGPGKDHCYDDSRGKLNSKGIISKIYLLLSDMFKVIAIYK